MPDPEIGEDMRFQAWEWRLQRVGWVLLAALVAAALAGLLGRGPLSRDHIELRTLRVDYQRIARKEDPTALDITYRQKQGDTSVVLEFRRQCLEGMELEAARPQPKGTMAREGEGLSFEFDLAPGAEWTKLHFMLRAEKAGIRSCEVRADEELAFLEFRQLILP